MHNQAMPPPHSSLKIHKAMAHPVIAIPVTVKDRMVEGAIMVATPAQIPGAIVDQTSAGHGTVVAVVAICPGTAVVAVAAATICPGTAVAVVVVVATCHGTAVVAVAAATICPGTVVVEVATCPGTVVAEVATCPGTAVEEVATCPGTAVEEVATCPGTAVEEVVATGWIKTDSQIAGMTC
jgi:hypothetical protein